MIQLHVQMLVHVTSTVTTLVHMVQQLLTLTEQLQFQHVTTYQSTQQFQVLEQERAIQLLFLVLMQIRATLLYTKEDQLRTLLLKVQLH